MVELVGISDLAKRWGYTRAGVHRLMESEDFPEPIGAINNGRYRVWSLDQFSEFESNKPELWDEHEKRRKQLGYFLAIQKGRGKQD